jgi:hypothetical protein
MAVEIAAGLVRQEAHRFGFAQIAAPTRSRGSFCPAMQGYGPPKSPYLDKNSKG